TVFMDRAHKVFVGVALATPVAGNRPSEPPSGSSAAAPPGKAVGREKALADGPMAERPSAGAGRTKAGANTSRVEVSGRRFTGGAQAWVPLGGHRGAGRIKADSNVDQSRGRIHRGIPAVRVGQFLTRGTGYTWSASATTDLDTPAGGRGGGHA